MTEQKKKPPKGPSLRNRKGLFALSGNRCAFPDCSTRLVDKETRSIVGEVCHIKGDKPGKARYDKDQDDFDRHGFDNLIVLCNVHHKVIDDNPDDYSVECLTELKRKHESKQEGKEVVDDAMTEQFVSAKKLKVRISPTHNGRQQLAQVRLFNSGPGPILISHWLAEWGRAHGFASVSTVRGKLPVRIEEQDAAEVFVEIGENLEELSAFGVVDGDGHLWRADEGNVVAFKHEAISHRLPPLPTDEEREESLQGCEVEIETRTGSSLRGPRLEVRFKNKNEKPIPVTRAKLSWTYTPPRTRPSQAEFPSVTEVEGSVTLTRQSRSNVINPGEETVFVLDDQLSCCLIEVLRGDVLDENIKVEISTSKGVKWVGTMNEIPGAVRSVAQAILERMHAARNG